MGKIREALQITKALVRAYVQAAWEVWSGRGDRRVEKEKSQKPPKEADS